MSKYPSMNYIGNKMKISHWIVEFFPADCETVVDLFAGGCSISYEMKKRGLKVLSNDALFSNYCIGKAIIENQNKILLHRDYKNKHISDEAINIKARELNYLANNIYYDYEVRELAKLVLISEKLSGYKKSLFLALLRRAMIRKIPYSRMNVEWSEIIKLRNEDYSYRKYGRYRAYHNKSFEYHIDDYLEEFNYSVFDNGKKNRMYQKDALVFCKELKQKVDLVYLDPPYPSTMNNYDAFYGYFDLMFNKKKNITLNLTKKESFTHNLELIVKALKKKTKYIAISLNNNSKPSVEDISAMLAKYANNIELYTRKHNYKITGKEHKNSNYEILILANLK